MKKHYHGHRQRLKEKFLQAPTSLADYELLELLLFYAVPRRDTKPLAKELLIQHKNLKSVLSAEATDNIKSLLSVVAEYHRRLLKKEAQTKTTLSSFDALVAYAQWLMGDLKHEVFYAVFLDTKYQLIKEQKLQEGTIDQVAIYPKELIKAALLIGAKNIVILHNHPSGDVTPSRADIDLTKAINNMAQQFDIHLLDHIIIGQGNSYSLKACGCF